jgi:hypothetical protein
MPLQELFASIHRVSFEFVEAFDAEVHWDGYAETAYSEVLLPKTNTERSTFRPE